VLVVGLGLEVGWLPTLLTGSRNGEIQVGGRGYLDCSQFVELLEVPTQRVDRSMGDVHPGGNPHYMSDPRRVTAVARGIARRMASLDPDNADQYTSRAGRFVTRLNEARQRWERELSRLRGQKIIGYHRSFPYLASWLGLEVVTYLEPRPGIPPNPRHVAQVLGLARQQNVRLIIQETYFPTSVSEAVAERAGAHLAVLPGGPDFRGGESYFDYIDRVSRALRGGGR
jgi:zinc/manganese transport system substrate-binding protein